MMFITALYYDKKLEVIEVYKKIMIMDCLMMKPWAIVKIMSL